MLNHANCFYRRCLSAAALFLACTALAGAADDGAPSSLPASVQAALKRAGLPVDAMAAVVVPVEGKGSGRLSWQAAKAMNPASVMKLTTTFAALDLLGPAYTWKTTVSVDGPIRSGTLHGNLYVRGSGDPLLLLEQLWLLLRRVQASGIHTIAGDIVVDGSAFQPAPKDPAAFDGEPLRPYNAGPEALLLNFKSLVLTLVPDPAAGVARVQVAPPLAGLDVPDTVPLVSANTVCGDWRARLQLNLTHSARLGLDGSYAPSCGERSWAIAPPEPELFAPRALAGLWRDQGGQTSGAARLGKVPAGATVLFTYTSPALLQAVQSVNKYSNNVMAQQLFLTLGLEVGGAGDPEVARQTMAAWWERRVGTTAASAQPPRFDNGAGLSRDARISADAMARMLQRAWASPVMPELMASLPIVGVDGTLRRSKSRAVGSAHLKTGSLRDVLAVAGYVLAEDGRRWVLVAFINHANAASARPALDALIDWTASAP